MIHVGKKGGASFKEQNHCSVYRFLNLLLFTPFPYKPIKTPIYCLPFADAGWMAGTAMLTDPMLSDEA